jgi:hypothetical protein
MGARSGAFPTNGCLQAIEPSAGFTFNLDGAPNACDYWWSMGLQVAESADFLM